MKKIHLLMMTLITLTACSSPREATVTAPVVEPLAQERVAEVFARIEAGEELELDLVYQALIGPQLTLRAYAARYLGSHGEAASIPHLIAALADESMHVGANYVDPGMATTRYWANEALKQLTGEDFGFVWDDLIDDREAAIARWETWYADQALGREP